MEKMQISLVSVVERHVLWDIAEKLDIEASALVPKRHELSDFEVSVAAMTYRLANLEVLV